VFNFTKYVEWPAAYTDGDFVITILGNSPMYNELLYNVKGKQAGKQPIEVLRAGNISGIKQCHILYIPSQQSNLLEAVQKHLEGKPTLIITEKKGLIQEGADINIVQINGKLKYEIRPQQIESKRLKVSKTLLNVGIIYDTNTPIRRIPALESADETTVPR
jgi:preprotein translocase subunit SecY